MFNFVEDNLKAPLIHIGFPRSASTWLQSYLFNQEHGFAKIMGPIDVQLNLIDPPAFAFEPDKSKAFIGQKTADIEGLKNRVPVITSEALCGSAFGGGYDGKELADRLHMVCPDGRILIIVREQKALIFSLYALIIQWGLPHSMKQFLNPVGPRIAPQFNYEWLQYDRIVSYYHDIFGKHRVLVLPFEQFTTEPERFIKSLNAFSGNWQYSEGDSHDLPFNIKSNSNPMYLRLVFQRWINYVFLSSAFNYSGFIKDTKKSSLLKYIRACQGIPDVFPNFVNERAKKGCQKYIEEEARGKFAESNRKLNDLVNLDLSTYGYEM